MICRAAKQLISLLFILHILPAAADDNGVHKLTENDAGTVSVPIEGADSYWVLLNECRLADWGYGRSGTSISYKALDYGDLFYFQQYRGDVAKFAVEIAMLELIREPHCITNAGAKWYKIGEATTPWNQVIANNPPNIASRTIALSIKDSYDRIVKLDPSLTVAQILARLPKNNNPLPTTLTTNADIDLLEKCLDVAAINKMLLDRMLVLHANNHLGIADFTMSRYQVRKPFSSSTINIGTAFMISGGTALTTQYLSVYPSVLLSGEGQSLWDSLSFDFGIAQSYGGTASDKFESADQHYLIGIGFHATDNFSINASNILTYYKGEKTENDFAIGISFDLLKAISGWK